MIWKSHVKDSWDLYVKPNNTHIAALYINNGNLRVWFADPNIKSLRVRGNEDNIERAQKLVMDHLIEFATEKENYYHNLVLELGGASILRTQGCPFKVGDKIRYKKGSMWSPYFNYNHVTEAVILSIMDDNIWNIKIKITKSENKGLEGHILDVCSLYFEPAGEGE